MYGYREGGLVSFVCGIIVDIFANTELEGVYEQLGQWLDEVSVPLEGEMDHQKLRDVAVVQFAGSLLKRTLSESFVGVPLDRDEYCDPSECENKSVAKLAIAARSLSLELARHKHRLAAQLVSHHFTQSKWV